MDKEYNAVAALYDFVNPERRDRKYGIAGHAVLYIQDSTSQFAERLSCGNVAMSGKFHVVEDEETIIDFHWTHQYESYRISECFALMEKKVQRRVDEDYRSYLSMIERQNERRPKGAKEIKPYYLPPRLVHVKFVVTVYTREDAKRDEGLILDSVKSFFGEQGVDSFSVNGEKFSVKNRDEQ